MRAYLATAPGVGSLKNLELSDLPASPMLVRVEHSDLNYKDALAITGKSPILRKFPIVPGIDLAGEVVEDESGTFKKGDRILAIGHGMGEDKWGGYSEFARIEPAAALPLPNGLSTRHSMALGTAGLTAALSWLEIESGLRTTPSRDLPPAGEVRDQRERVGGEEPRDRRTFRVLVTGATGGVGSVAIMLLRALGCRVIASTGRPAMKDFYLKSLGAHEVVWRENLAEPGKPLGTQWWDAAIDTVGGAVLNGVLRSTAEGGVVASCGMAGGAELTTSVFPFILRSVRLVGIHSYFPPKEVLQSAWQLLADTIDFHQLDRITTEIGLEGLEKRAAEMLDNRTEGRTVVRVTN